MKNVFLISAMAGHLLSAPLQGGEKPVSVCTAIQRAYEGHSEAVTVTGIIVGGGFGFSITADPPCKVPPRLRRFGPPAINVVVPLDIAKSPTPRGAKDDALRAAFWYRSGARRMMVAAVTLKGTLEVRTFYGAAEIGERISPGFGHLSECPAQLRVTEVVRSAIVRYIDVDRLAR